MNETPRRMLIPCIDENTIMSGHELLLMQIDDNIVKYR